MNPSKAAVSSFRSGRARYTAVVAALHNTDSDNKLMYHGQRHESTQRALSRSGWLMARGLARKYGSPRVDVARACCDDPGAASMGGRDFDARCARLGLC
jgi:hypothetical protein